ncbi:MAG: citramalate synthase [Verrucomicrobiota bacterium]|jgi:2-isopropylmalate synthase|nr:citramalate synthase [Verrucomicrobiota bacterium]
MSKDQVEIYDTTLRDGTQGEGVSFSVADKLRVAEKLDAFGVHYIEGGWPGSNPKDIEFFKQAAKAKWKNTKIAAFGSTRRKKVEAKDDPQVKLLLEAKTPVVTIFGKTWLLHVKEVLRTTPKENLAMIADTIAFLKKKRKTVIYDAEHALDGYKDNPEYAVATWKAAEEAGADYVVLCDTNGGSLSSEVAEITAAARAQLTCDLGIHTHNDIGLGVANALAGVNAGATQVQGTINGYGERTGNCNLTSVIPNIAVKMGRKSIPKASVKKLRDLSRFVDEMANLVPDRHQPWVGGTAFAHKGGMHVNAVQKVAHSFEHINPEVVGNQRRILVSDLAGRSNIVMKAQEMGIRINNDTPEIKDILTKVKEQEHLGYDYEGAEGSLALLIRKVLGRVEPAFDLEAYHVSMRGDALEYVCEATVKVKVGDKAAHTVADGDGPVNALDQALRNALREFYPALKKVRLTDYKVRILNSGSGTAAKTRVLIESTDGKERWYTVGVNENIIEASLQALLDSIEYRLLKK